MLSAVYFLNTNVTYGIFLGCPASSPTPPATAGCSSPLITAIPFAFALVAMVLVGRHSDRTGERKGHVAACALIAALGLLVVVWSPSSVALIVFSFALCQIGQRSVMPPFWAIPPIFLGGTAAAAGIALINAIGNLGGCRRPERHGRPQGPVRRVHGGLLVLVAALLVEAVLVLLIRLPRRRAPQDDDVACGSRHRHEAHRRRGRPRPG